MSEVGWGNKDMKENMDFYLDNKLKKRTKLSLSDAELETVLEKSIFLFKYLQVGYILPQCQAFTT